MMKPTIILFAMLIWLPVGLCAAAREPLPGNAERLSHGRFDDVVVYRPDGDPGGFVLLLSGEDGWNGGMQQMAQDLVRKGAMVAGIDTPRFYAVLERDGGDCEFTGGDLENLSHFVQAYYKLPTYLAPILAGYSSGAAFAYANLAQAPKDTFGGALGLGFCPELELRKPLCKGTGLDFRRRADGKGVDLLPAKALTSPMTVLQGAADQACALSAVQPFLAQVPLASLTALPGVDHGLAGSGWEPQFQDAYAGLAQALKPQALPAPPASLEGLPVIEVPAQAGVPQSAAFALLMSGDGGWAGLDQSVATALTARGVAVVGLDSLRYYWTPRTPESVAADVDRIIRYYLDHWNKKQALLVGYSQGADVLPFILNRLPAATRQQVALGALMGLSEHALFEFHLGNWVNANQDQGLPTLPEMMRPGPTPLLCIYGADETDTLCPRLDPQRVRLVKLKGGHHFDGDYQRLAGEILDAAGLSSAGTTVAANPAQTPVPSGTFNPGNFDMLTLHIPYVPLLSLLAGILILAAPRLLNYVVAIYLIAVGLLGLIH